MKADEEQMAEALIATRKRATGSFLYRVWCECSLHPGDSNVCVCGGGFSSVQILQVQGVLPGSNF